MARSTATAKTLLAIARTDRTFEPVEVRGRSAWQGRCIHCNGHLLLEADGTPISRVTIEHLVPRSAGGTDELGNLALACARCNHQKGARHDRKGLGDARTAELVEKLLAKRQARWRAPEDEDADDDGAE